jgi:glutaredoxin
MTPAGGSSGAGGGGLSHRVVLYSRPGCHLCDVARDVLLSARERSPFDFEEVDIERDEVLELEYGIRIPVVAVDGEERFEVAIDERELARLLRDPPPDTRS